MDLSRSDNRFSRSQRNPYVVNIVHTRSRYTFHKLQMNQDLGSHVDLFQKKLLIDACYARMGKMLVYLGCTITREEIMNQLNCSVLDS